MKYRSIIIIVVAVIFVACGGPEERQAKYRARAQEFIEAGNFAKARMALRNVLIIDPKDVDSYFLFAQVEEKEKNWQNAVRLYQEVIKLDPDHTTASIILAKYYLQAHLTERALSTADNVLAKHPHHPQARAIKIAVLAEEGPFPDVMTKAEALRSQFPTEPDVAILLATLYGQHQRYRDAEATLRHALKTHPQDVDLLNNLNTILVETKDMESAEIVARRLIEIESRVIDHRLRLAQLFDSQGQYEKAETVLREAIFLDLNSGELVPNTLEPLLSLVKLEVAHGRADRAREHLDALLARRPDHLFGHGLLGQVLALSGHSQEADAQFREASRLNPKWIMPWLDWGGLWLAQKQPGLAIEVIQNGLKANPTSEELHMLLASAYSTQGQIEHAITAYDDALRLNPGNVLAANNLAVLLVDHKGDAQSLRKAFTLSRDFEKDAPHPLFLDTLGWVRFKMGQYEDALRLMKDAVAKSPTVPTLNYHLGIALYQSGKTGESRIYLSKALKSAEKFQGRQEAEQILLRMRG